MDTPKVCYSLAHHPPVDKQDGSVRLGSGGRAAIEYKAHGNVEIVWNSQIEGCHEEPNARYGVWQAFRNVSRNPFRCVESWEVPTFPLSEKPPFIKDTTSLVGEANRNLEIKMPVITAQLTWCIHPAFLGLSTLRNCLCPA